MTDLDALAALAEAATPGPWHVQLDSVYPEGRQPGWQPTPVEGGAIDARWPILAGENQRADAAYIAAADPTTILALIDRLRAAEAVCEAAHDARTGYDFIPMWDAMDAWEATR